MSDRLGARVVALTVLGLAVVAGGAYAGLNVWAGDIAPRSARVEGVSVAGLSIAQARATLQRELAARERATVQVTLGDGRLSAVDPSAAGLAVDYAASVRRAMGGERFSVGRTLAVLTGGGDHDAVVVVERRRMEAALDRLDASLATRPVEGTVAFRDGKAVPVLSQPGTVVDRSAARVLIERRFLHQGTQKVPTRVEDPDISDAEVQRALTQFGTPAMSGPVTLVLGGQRVAAPPRLFGRALSMVDQEGRLVPQVDGPRMVEALAPVMRAISTEPVDARFVVRRDRPVLVPARTGVQFDPGDLEAGFATAAVGRTRAQRRLKVDGTSTEPGLTTAEAKALGIHRRVSTFSTRFAYADYRNVNLARAATLLDGTIVGPDDTFSLNRTIGPRTRANGFTEGFVVSDGKVVADLGGGISQLATTVLNTLLLAGMVDVEHTPPAVHTEGDPAGREATVGSSVDLRLANDTPDAVLLVASVRRSTPTRKGTITVSAYSTKRWDIRLTAGPRTDVRRPRTQVVRTRGCQARTGSPGFDIDVDRSFRRTGSAQVVRTDRFHTTYVAQDAVRCSRR